MKVEMLHKGPYHDPPEMPGEWSYRGSYRIEPRDDWNVDVWTDEIHLLTRFHDDDGSTVEDTRHLADLETSFRLPGIANCLYKILGRKEFRALAVRVNSWRVKQAGTRTDAGS